MEFNLLKLRAKIRYLTLRGKIGKLSSRIELPHFNFQMKSILVCFPVDEASFRVASYSLRKFNETSLSHINFIFLVKEEFKNLIHFPRGHVIYFRIEDGNLDEQISSKIKLIQQNNHFDLVIDLNPNFQLEISKLISNISSQYKIGFRSKLSDKFYNIQLDISKTGFLERGYQQINLMLAEL
ncbi:MAG: hypothetical protein ISR90_00825 [Candidatus Marinimicrobia bacterium]|nr:hypothetical protein [Candidatus Neomarinimicrobiota bacterium]MBL7022587.1 hypothetical protein [Candidatus Neomarinimicrobiota bacterium]MBL7108943.1 hypothetical protein [Candidatus Neomarinimicrobiota bacterium]